MEEEQQLTEYRRKLKLAKSNNIPIYRSSRPGVECEFWVSDVVLQLLNKSGDLKALDLNLVDILSTDKKKRVKSKSRVLRSFTYISILKYIVNTKDLIAEPDLKSLRGKDWSDVIDDTEAIALLITDILYCWNTQPTCVRAMRKADEALVQAYFKVMNNSGYTHAEIKTAIKNYAKWYGFHKANPENVWFYQWNLSAFLTRYDKTINRCIDWNELALSQKLPKKNEDKFGNPTDEQGRPLDSHGNVIYRGMTQ